METVIVNPPEVFPGLSFTGAELTNFVYYPKADAYGLCLNECKGHEIFKPADSYLFRIWLTFYDVPEYPARKQNYYRTTITMKQDHREKETPPTKLKPTKAEKTFERLAIAFGVIVGCTYVACMVFKFVVDSHGKPALSFIALFSW